MSDDDIGYATVTLSRARLRSTHILGQFHFCASGPLSADLGVVFLTPELARQWIKVLTPLAESEVAS